MIYIIGYAVSVLIGIPVTFLWSCFLHGVMHGHKEGNDNATADRLVPLWIPILIGVFERAIITTIIAWSVPGAAAFIGAWIAVKTAGGWSGWEKGTSYGRSMFFVRLLGSAMSIGFALVGGIIIAVYRAN